MKVLFKKIWVEIAIIFLISLTPLLWFGDKSIIVGHDNVFGLNPTNFLIGRLYSWIGFNFGQGQALIMGTIPTHFIDAIPSFLGLPIYLTEKIVYVFWFFAIGISMYVLASVINKESRTFKIAAVILYQFNFFILSAWWIGERTKFSAYIAFPLVIVVLWLVYKEKLSNSKAAAINILTLFIFNGGGLFGIPLFGGFFIGYTVFILFFSYLSLIRWKLRTIKNFLLVTIITMVGVLLINSYYLFPAGSEILAQYKSGVGVHGGLSGLVTWASEISANTSFINLFRLQGISDWYDNSSHPYAKNYLTNYLLIAISFMWLFLGFFALLRVKDKEKKEFVLYCFIVFLLGIFLSAGTHPPFGYVYVFLLEHIPGFAIFRSPYFKFAPAIFLPLSLLVAFTLDSITKKNLRKVIFISFIAVVFLYHYPYFLGNFFSWKEGYSTKNQIPDYIFTFGAWAEKNIHDERILLLPGSVPDWQFDAYQWGYLSLQTLPTLITNKSILSDDNKLNIEEKTLLTELYSSIEKGDREQARKISSMLRVKYILVREDISYNQNWTRLGNPYRYQEILQNTFGFPLEKSFDKWKVYRVTFEQMPKVFTASSIESFDGPVSLLSGYFFTVPNTPIYFINSDKDQTKSSEISHIPSSKVIALPCMNCTGSGRQIIEFPRSLILPDSPFYSFVLLRESLKKRNPDTKARIYDDIGFSLKRFGEIKGLVVNSKYIKREDLDRYANTLYLLRDDFNSLEKFNDKLEISQDIHFYLSQEVVQLRDLFRYPIYSKDNLGESTKSLFDAISSINTLIKPYIKMINDPSQKLYYFETDKKGRYSLLLNNYSQSQDKYTVKFSINNQAAKNVDVVGSNAWSDLGKITFEDKPHVLRLTLPTMENLAQELRLDTFRLDVSEDAQCYTSKIENFTNTKTYQISFQIPKELNNRLYTYIKKDKKNGQKFDLLTKYDNVLIPSQKMLISPDQEAKNAYFGVCAENISKTDLANKLGLRIDEVIYPKLLLVPEVRQTPVFESVETQFIDPTKYLVHVKINEPTILGFSERFDHGWKLSQFNDTHFRIQGFANGWTISKPGEYNLTLEYEPQKRFYQGLIITTIIFFICLVFVVRKGGKNEKN